jgi:hypothetical protein
MSGSIPVETFPCPTCGASRTPATGQAWRRRFCGARCRRRAEFELRQLRRRLPKEQAEVDRIRPCTGLSLYQEIRTLDGRSIHDLLRPLVRALTETHGRMQALGEPRRSRNAPRERGR